jgi:hypothetical protein
MSENASHWTSRYVRDRERVRGRRWQLSQDPSIAAEQLAEYLCGIAPAKTWARDVLACLKRRSK